MAGRLSPLLVHTQAAKQAASGQLTASCIIELDQFYVDRGNFEEPHIFVTSCAIKEPSPSGCIKGAFRGPNNPVGKERGMLFCLSTTAASYIFHQPFIFVLVLFPYVPWNFVNRGMGLHQTHMALVSLLSSRVGHATVSGDILFVVEEEQKENKVPNSGKLCTPGSVQRRGQAAQRTPPSTG